MNARDFVNRRYVGSALALVAGASLSLSFAPFGWWPVAILAPAVLGAQRRPIVEGALGSAGGILVSDSVERAVAFANEYAAEHLLLAVADPDRVAPALRNAGAVFLGLSSSVVFGDYLTGGNHVLPTGGTARYASPLGVYDFVKRTSVIRYTAERLAADAEAIVALAEAEGLYGHAEAVRIRGAAGPRGRRRVRRGPRRARGRWTSDVLPCQ